MDSLKVSTLRCEYRTNPLGIGARNPQLSWQIESERRGTMQRGYQIVVANEWGDFNAPVWDTGFTESDQSIQIAYEGEELKSRTRYWYKVKVWDHFGRESAWSDAAWWEMGLLDQGEWQAAWISPDRNEIDPQSEPAFLLRKDFDVLGDVQSARIYATAAGVYELYVNGERVSDEWLAPGWTSYPSRLQVQTYEVTDLLCKDGNGLGIVLADGWYKSGMGFEGKNFKYGEQRAALAQLHITYKDGTESIVGTDASWKASTGPIQYAAIYHGETYDARLEHAGWSSANFQDDEWKPTQVCSDISLDVLVPQENAPTRVTEKLRPIAAFVTPAGDNVLDMGQNMVGRVRVTVNAPAGTRIVLKHAEVLDKDGNIYFGNLRAAKQVVSYITKGNGPESYAPYFSFMGFRYVKVEGFPGQENGLPLDAFVGEVMHTDMEPTGEFACSDARVNQLQSNIRWGQRGNFLDVPTDCPQRDERLGWTGDAQVFISTALFNYQGGPFFTKWLHDLKAEQKPNGGVPFVVPNVVGGENSAAWGDAAVICPWTVYQYYGDKRLLAEQYESMKGWIAYIRSQGEQEFIWNTGFHFGDWLALDAKENSYIGATPTALIATAYYAYSTRIVRDAAQVLGHDEDARELNELHQNVIQAFRDEFMTKTGRIASPTQTAHILALVFDLVDDSVRARVAKDLNQLIIDNDYHLTTGFVGTPYLCFALSDSGYHETAVKLLLQESYPGWLYSVSKGATTIWEHWDSIKADGSFWSDDMNSFNHYAYGAIGDWMYRKIAGLDMDVSVPAFKKIHIEPLFGLNSLSYAKAAHTSLYGRIESGWQVDKGDIRVQLRVPANTSAQVILTGAAIGAIKEGEIELDTTLPGVLAISEVDQGVRILVGSGDYSFSYTNSDLFRVQYNEHSRIQDVLEDEAAAAVLKKHMLALIEGPFLNFVRKSTIKQLGENTMTGVTRQQIDALVADLILL
ncbi:alpha-L-rhamnosidase [Paenibacillus aceris]|uniref:alpha-L-rhamnosidase n=1 Tax=Paenibacillus aceris TaxID=869555 RepID=A0ABS4I3J5_9BACL|nr:alpha-L-rhamnosidase [Paenibacillus aceris]MBP1965470.1 alpha-L-rhamnosidase [Paenibacillus aceris]NHW33480.1 family 78 glycoside hydrolase catalytic domain [Paenibacillus aceris]